MPLYHAAIQESPVGAAPLTLAHAVVGERVYWGAQPQDSLAQPETSLPPQVVRHRVITGISSQIDIDCCLGTTVILSAPKILKK